ncbi:C39 family peptidase [Patescibacteria group bacterium]|nr:C39 family peptidase [Patescibacteria group bacterium]
MKKYLVIMVLVVAAGGWFWFSQQAKNSKMVEVGGNQSDIVELVDNKNKSIDNTDESVAEEKTLTNDQVIENKSAEVEKTVESKNNSEPKIEHAITILPVPFTSQAPKYNWDLPYQEACEEASMIMAAEYFKGNRVSRLEPDYADKEILKLVAWQKLERGFYEDTTAQEVADIMKDYFGLSAAVEEYDAVKIKDYIRQGKLVLLPAAGRLLNNPNFKHPGPLYHMLVVKGFTTDEFITNDPGTKNGFNYYYRPSIFATAVHDWNGGKVTEGQQVMVVVGN